MENSNFVYFNEDFDALRGEDIAAVALEMLLHTGKKGVICADALMEKLGIECSNSIARKYLHAAALKYRLPMVSCRKGFYLATCQRDIDEYNDNINRRITEMCRVQRAINEAYRLHHMEY